MKNQLLKLFLVIILLTTVASAFGQFPLEIYQGAKPSGKTDSIIAHQPDGGKNLYIFNKKGQIAEEYNYYYMQNPDFGTIFRDTMKTVYQYDGNGHLLASANYHRKRQSTCGYRYLYSDSGYVIKTISTNQNNRGWYEMRFNNSGKLIQTRTYPEGLGNDMDYKYNKKGYLIEQSYSYNKRFPASKTFYKYDADGNIITTSTKRPFGPLTFNYTYIKYDKMHNWLVRNTYRDSTFLYKIERHITYHK